MNAQQDDRILLEQTLENYIDKELTSWLKVFPDEFFERLFRLKNWQYKPILIRKPSELGKAVNDLIFNRLSPEIIDDLKKNPPKRRKSTYTIDDIKHDRLREHFSNVIMLMKAAPLSWANFYRSIQRALPKY